MLEIDSKIYKLKNITDLCSNIRVKNPEFRITELKSSMRFWWRALNFYTKISDMKKEEEKIFGNSDNFKSPVIFKIKSNEFKSSDGGHEVRNNNKINCFKSGKCVEIKLSLYKRKINEKEYTNKDLYYYDSLLKISLILGGIGQRSRRGCGVFKFDEQNVDGALKDEVRKYMENLNVSKYYDFTKEDDKCYQIVRIDEYKNRGDKYPYIEEISICKKYDSEDGFYKKVKEAIDTARNQNLQYKKCKKLACPVYLTCYGDLNKLYPIIVKLYNTNEHETYEAYYDKFKEVILK